MPKSHAERQRDYRERVARRLAERHAEDERLAVALEAENARLTAELATLRAERAGLLEEAERLRAGACRHPSAFVEGTHCHACGNDVD